MNCHDFDQVWNQSLDALRQGSVDDHSWVARDQALREHAESCSSCWSRHRQFETLRQALDAWTARSETRPAPSTELADRIIAAVARPEPSEVDRRDRRVRRRVAVFALASAAAVLLAVLGPRFRPEPLRTADAPISTAADSRHPLKRGLLGGAVGDATAASWQLALLASEPAARLGKEMIDASFDSDTDGGPFQPAGLPTTSDLSLLDAESFSPDLINQMGGALADGVRPLSTSARRAFGFLRAPNTEKPEGPVVRPSTGKGA